MRLKPKVVALLFFQTALLSKVVHVNQVGHLPHLSKTFFASAKADSFFLCDAPTA